jgi:hypothetical protein
MRDVRSLPEQLQIDLQPVGFLAVPWRPPMEVNLWMGSPMVTTPFHYDMVRILFFYYMVKIEIDIDVKMHNMYTQIMGKKRFILISPEYYKNLYLFTSLHPSSRQSQILVKFSRQFLANKYRPH